MRHEKALSPYVLFAAGMLSLSACSGTSPEGGPVEPISDQRQSTATRIESDGTGHCNFSASPDDLNLAALGNTDYVNGAMCGACLEVEGPNQKKVVARVVDSCSGCSAEQIALTKQVFDKMGAADLLWTSIRWRYVTCPVVGPLSYRFKEDSSPYWVAIQVRNHRLPIQKLEWQKNGAWVEVKREPYNYFVEPGGMGPGPIRVRVTASDGQQLEDTLPQVIQATVVQGAAQFEAD
jgi:expansin (peptidoglycan-binding protein)